MPTSWKSVVKSKPSRPKHTALKRRLIAGLDEVAAYMRGEIELTRYEIQVPERADGKAASATGSNACGQSAIPTHLRNFGPSW